MEISPTTCTTTLLGASIASGFCAYEVPVAVNQPRGILSVGETDFLAVERGSSSVILVSDTDGNGLPGVYVKRCTTGCTILVYFGVLGTPKVHLFTNFCKKVYHSGLEPITFFCTAWVDFCLL